MPRRQRLPLPFRPARRSIMENTSPPAIPAPRYRLGRLARAFPRLSCPVGLTRIYPWSGQAASLAPRPVRSTPHARFSIPAAPLGEPRRRWSRQFAPIRFAGIGYITEGNGNGSNQTAGIYLDRAGGGDRDPRNPGRYGHTEVRQHAGRSGRRLRASDSRGDFFRGIDPL